MALFTNIQAEASDSDSLKIDWQTAATQTSWEPPREDLVVWQADSAAKQPEGKLSNPIGRTGTLSFWFHPTRSYTPKRGLDESIESLVDLQGLADISLRLDSSEVTLFVEWAGDTDILFERHIRIIIPSLPDDDWVHFSLSWDADAGLFNALINGTPFYIPGVAIEPFQLGSSQSIAIGNQNIPVAGIEVLPTYMEHTQIRKKVGTDRLDSLAHLLGAERLPPFDIEARRGRLLYANALDHPDRVRSWVMEGPGILTAKDGWLHLESERPDGPQGHMVLWCPEDFPASFIAEWEFVLEDPVGLCIVFFAATGPEGQSIFDPEMRPRTGEFAHYVYSDLHAYHISYYASTPWVPRSMANLRKNPGLHLLGNGPIEVRAIGGKVYRAQLVKDGPHLRLSIDGHTIIDTTDTGENFDAPLRGGKIGLRQMQWTNARYRNFRVHELMAE